MNCSGVRVVYVSSSMRPSHLIHQQSASVQSSDDHRFKWINPPRVAGLLVNIQLKILVVIKEAATLLVDSQVKWVTLLKHVAIVATSDLCLHLDALPAYFRPTHRNRVTPSIYKLIKNKGLHQSSSKEANQLEYLSGLASAIWPEFSSSWSGDSRGWRQNPRMAGIDRRPASSRRETWVSGHWSPVGLPYRGPYAGKPPVCINKTMIRFRREMWFLRDEQYFVLRWSYDVISNQNPSYCRWHRSKGAQSTLPQPGCQVLWQDQGFRSDKNDAANKS